MMWPLALAPLVLTTVVVVGQAGLRNAILATDFRAYYTAARMLLGGVRSDFYSPATQLAWQQAWVPELNGIAELNPFRNPPFVAALFAPLGLLPPEIAFVIWSAFNLGLLCALLVLSRRALAVCGPRSRRRALLLSVSFLPVVVTLMLGQVSLLLTIGLLSAWTALRSGRDGRAGLALALLLIRPQFILLPALLLVVHRRWRAVGTLACVGVALFIVSLALVGWDGLVSYAQLVTGTLNWQDSYSISPERMHTWRGFLQLLLQTDDPSPVHAAWVAGALIATLIALISWRGKWDPTSARFDVQWALLVVASLFVSPYANFHDLSLLLVAGILATRARSVNWDRASVPTLLAALPLVGYASSLATQLSAPLWHVQLSVVFMAASIAVLGWVATRSPAQLPATTVDQTSWPGDHVERSAIRAAAH
jgi:hypothetical protein